MSEQNNYRIFGQFVTQSPLSHIGESISTVSYLVEEPILQENGSIEPVFTYNGNAWRGQLRDLSATYLIEKLGLTLNIDSFHLLFSGGKIGGDQSIDLAKAREMRRVVPMIGLFGGGIGNQILPGKLRVGSSYPVCKEAIRLMPDFLKDQAQKVSYRQMTMEKSFTRKDDSKHPDLCARLAYDDLLLLESSEKKKAEVSTQMRTTCELLISGVTLYHQIDLLGVSDIELGVLVSALHKFSESPHIGGQANKGHGLVSYFSRVINTKTGEEHDLVKLSSDKPPRLSQFAQDAKDAYDTLLREQYDSYIESRKSEISGLLGGK